MVNFIPSVIDYIHENVDPSYMKEKEESKKAIQAAGLISTAGIIASAALAILGLTSGGLVGSALILVSLPAGYLSYNAYKMFGNIHDIIDNPKIYQNSLGLEPTFDKQKLKAKLMQDTVCFNFCVDFIVEEMAKAGMAKNRSFG